MAADLGTKELRRKIIEGMDFEPEIRSQLMSVDDDTFERVVKLHGKIRNALVTNLKPEEYAERVRKYRGTGFDMSIIEYLDQLELVSDKNIPEQLEILWDIREDETQEAFGIYPLKELEESHVYQELAERAVEKQTYPATHGISQEYIAPAEDLIVEPFSPSPTMYPERPIVIEEFVDPEEVSRVRKPRVERARSFGKQRTTKRKPSTRRNRVYQVIQPPPPIEIEPQVIQVIHKQAPRWYDEDFEYDYEYSRPMITAAKVSPSWTFVRESMGTSGVVEFYISPEGYRVVDWGTYGMYGPFRSKAKADEIFRDLTNSYY